MEILAVLILSFLVLLLAGWVGFLEYRFQTLSRSVGLLLTGRGGADLEATLMDYVARMDHVERVAQGMDGRAQQLESYLPTMLQHIGVVRFNPFPDKGGDQSFVVAILDAHGDGVVLTGLHSRVDSRVYAKPVVGQQSNYTLTGEEKEAIVRAMEGRV